MEDAGWCLGNRNQHGLEGVYILGGIEYVVGYIASTATRYQARLKDQTQISNADQLRISKRYHPSHRQLPLLASVHGVTVLPCLAFFLLLPFSTNCLDVRQRKAANCKTARTEAKTEHTKDYQRQSVLGRYTDCIGRCIGLRSASAQICSWPLILQIPETWARYRTWGSQM